MTGMARRLRSDEDGQDAIEYSLVVGLIALVCLGALTLFGNAFNGLWQSVATKVDEATALI